MNKRQAKKARKIQAERRTIEFDKLQKEILLKEEEYSNSLDENLNGNETILEELRVLKNKRSKLMVMKKQEVMNSYNGLKTSDNDSKKLVNEVKDNKATPVKSNQVESITSKKENDSSVSKSKSYYSSDSKAVIDALDFDSDKWVINYHEKGISKKEVYEVTKDKIDMLTIKLNSLYSNTKKIDIGLYSVLSDFDGKHKSNCLESYMNNKTLHATYNLKELFSNKKHSYSEKLDILLTAYRQKKYKKATVIKPKNNVIAPIAIGFSLMVGLIGIGAANSKNKTISYKNNDFSINFESEKNSEKTTAVLSENKEKVVVEKQINQTQTETKDEPILEKKEEFKLGDNYKLDGMTLQYSFDNRDLDKVAQTEKLNCKYYKPLYIAVANGNNILDLKNTSDLADKTLSDVVADYKDDFGEDIQIFLNFDGYDENDNKILSKAGWLDLAQLEVKKEITTQEKIEQLQELKKELVNMSQENSKAKVKTK